jgi:hypothetical protein
MAIGNVMAGLSVASSQQDEIKDQSDFTHYYTGYGWFGQLATFTTDSMFAVKIQAGVTSTLTIEGTPAILPKTLSLNDGWTWMPCPYQQEVTLSYLPSATGLDYAQGDQFKNFDDFTDYYAGYGWFGQLSSMVPGVGYMLKTSAPSPMALQSVTYQPYSGRRQLQKAVELSATVEAKAIAGAVPSDWVVHSARFAHTMTVSALITLNGAPQARGSLAALVGSELRGLQSTASIPPFGPYAGKSLYLTMVRANVEGETVSFSYFDGTKKVALDKTLKFVVNGKQGSVVEPFMLTERPKLFG